VICLWQKFGNILGELGVRIEEPKSSYLGMHLVDLAEITASLEHDEQRG
jgi:hypothetical protein